MTRNFASTRLITTPTKQAAPGKFVSRFLLVAAICASISLAVPTGLVALAEGAGAIPLPFNLHVVDIRLPGTFKLHMLAGGAALVLMPLVILLRARRAWHRPLGRITAALVVVAALTSFPVAYESTSPLVARAGFVAQGVVWLALVAAGIAAIRRKQRARHATLMLAMTAVASGAIWVRLTTAVTASWNLPFDLVYACATWLGWLIPLALVLAFSPVSILPHRPNPRPALAS